MVSRWYGGVHLGPDRFRHINNAARAAIEAHGAIPGALKAAAPAVAAGGGGAGGAKPRSSSGGGGRRR